ncbi:MAG: hypothetical protein ABEK00_04120 [Candidatus Nanohaloarchaea archaeon]
MDKNVFLLLAVVSGLVLGFAGASFDYQGSQSNLTYCESLETGIEANKTFKGVVDCFEPGRIDTYVPKPVNKSAELKCVCRKSFNGSVSWMNIAVSN